MTKAELIEKLQKGAAKNLSKRQIGELLDEMFDLIARSVKREKRFSFPGFGTWHVRKRAARTGRNPRTGAEIKISASKTVTFRPAPNLKNVL